MNMDELYVTVEERPLLTIERESYSRRRVGLLTPDNRVMVVPPELLIITAARLTTQAYALDCYLNPEVLKEHAEEKGYHLDPAAFQVICGEWISIHECGPCKKSKGK